MLFNVVCVKLTAEAWYLLLYQFQAQKAQTIELYEIYSSYRLLYRLKNQNLRDITY
jgi:hypothetical protein